MDARSALAIAALASGCAATTTTAGREGDNFLQIIPIATVCELKKGKPPRDGRARMVSITARVWYDFEYGYQLWDDACEPSPRVDNLLPITFRPSLSPEIPPDEFPELNKLHSEDFLRAAAEAKKGVSCRCIGEISYSNGFAILVLRRAEVYID